MSETILARRYSAAFFDLAREEGIVDRLEKDLNAFVGIISSDPDWFQVLKDEKVGIKQKNEMIDELVKPMELHERTVALIKMLIERKRIHILTDIIKYYKKACLKLNGFVEAVITVTDEHVMVELREEIELAIEKTISFKPKLKCKIDPTIIGGLIIKIGDKIYDGSIRGELARVKKSLLSKENEIR